MYNGARGSWLATGQFRAHASLHGVLVLQVLPMAWIVAWQCICSSRVLSRAFSIMRQRSI